MNDDEELHEKIVELVRDGEVDERSVAYSTAMKVVREGWTALSPTEREVFETKVEALLRDRAPLVDFGPADAS